MEKLKSELNNISKLFGYELFPNTKNFLPFLSYIKSISKPDLTICQKEMKYGYICLTCQVEFSDKPIIEIMKVFNKHKAFLLGNESYLLVND